MLLLLKNTKDNERDPTHMEGVLRAVQLANRSRQPIRFLYASHDGQVGIFIDAPDRLASLIAEQLYTHYPTLDIESFDERVLDPLAGDCVWHRDVVLRPDLYPIQRFSQYQETESRQVADPVAAILAAVHPGQSGALRSSIEIVTQPTGWWRNWRSRRAVQRLAGPDLRHALERTHWYAHGITDHRWPVRWATWLYGLRRRAIPSGISSQEVTTATGRQHDHEVAIKAAYQKVTSFGFTTHLRVLVIGPRKAEAEAFAKLTELQAVIAKTADPTLARFVAADVQRTNSRPPLRRKRGFLLSSDELATLVHPETRQVAAAGTIQNVCRKPQPPHQLPLAVDQPNVARLGRLQFRQRNDVFGIRAVDRRRHIYIPGKTGMGKTTLLQNMILSDIHAGRGVAVIDPHGDLAERIARSIPRRRWDDLVLFDPADVQFPVAFQPLDCSNAVSRELVAQGMLSTFAHLYRSVWGPRMESVFRNGLLAAVSMPEPTLLAVFQFLTDDSYREQHVARIDNPLVRQFWAEKFPNWNQRLRQEAIEPVLNKLETYLTSDTLRRILGQPRSKLRLREIMDEGRILIVNLSKGNLGEDNSRLLGSLLVTRFQQDAISRSNIPEDQRRDFYLYVDEFQNFATPSFETILSEARKYRLNLTVAHQYLGQLDQHNAGIRKAIFGNVGTIVTFGLGNEDAQFVAGELRDEVLPADLVHLPKYQAYVALMIDGQTSDPFLMQTLPPAKSYASPENYQALQNLSRSRYATPAASVDAALRREFVAASQPLQ